ncbi:CRISPR-associated protein, Csx11 family [Methanocaldococcus vulcanius M7]|uniref:CRISPR-associated protein, Csx11 family n=1 Tax=Methanocaldococcus vulcanius (strain ATCC 700851 / DSM 12094 / M7) TaxID=579137 RepID=C9RHU5_METVM|nr:CRISPR-associated protein Csx11 [Methanocaldococcus vulcanius]ACX73147.1 CRISPR-associated protein, Csx11 family [Methanocaldococcus vulcanius M7]
MAIDVNNLLNNKNEVLKAEIVSPFTLLDKTFVSWWQYVNSEYFKGVTPEYQNRDGEIKNLLKTFFNDLDVNIEGLEIKDKNGNIINKINVLNDFITTKWRENWRKVKLNDEPKKILQVLYGSSEGLNSGIEKGSPKEGNHIKGNYPYLANSFGTLKKLINEKQLDDLRDYISKYNVFDYKDEIKKILELKDDNYFEELDNEDDLQQVLSKLKTCSDVSKIRRKVYALIKLLYGFTPSDSRFPVNDTSLYDQAYMATTMFKASLAGLFLDNSKLKDLSKFDYRDIKWSILGIQYDKLGLAEKGLKVAHIQWYRETANKVDEEIKDLIEDKWALGNEIYRDETGIYFLVPECIVGDKIDKNLYELDKNLKNEERELKREILEIFKEKFGDEVYPTIILTKPSRGLMNLGYLLEKAKENFLRADYSLKRQFDDYFEGKIWVCQVCGERFVSKDRKRDEIPMCDVCYKRIHDDKHGRIKKWVENLNDETIWIDELQDENGRIALITLKFELKEWLNGNLLNSLIVREEDCNNFYDLIKNLLNNSKNYFINNLKIMTKLKEFYKNKEDIKDFLNLFDSSIKHIYNQLINKTDDILNKSFIEINTEIINLENELQNQNLSKKQRKRKTEKLNFIKRLPSLKEISKNYLVKLQTDYNIDLPIKFNEDGTFSINGLSYDDIRGVLSFIYFYDQINKLILERSIGDRWEEFIKNNLLNPSAIDFDERKIHWNNLTDEDIEFLSKLILQFLLRKNPSPARLRRIWETTKEFFEDLENNLIDILEIPEWRRKRIIIQLDEDEKPDGEYRYGNICFWKIRNKLYLITSIEQFLKVVGNNEIKKLLNNKEKEENLKELNKILNDKKKLMEKLNLRKIKLKSVENERDNIEIELDENNINLLDYKLYFSIIKPTPISWQFIIPAEYIPRLIEKIQNEYYKNFKWVYGKLPLHIGVIIQHYKSPLYIGIKALRKIRRDLKNLEDIKTEIDGKSLKSIQKELYSKYVRGEELANNTEEYYSLYEWDGDNETYQFYLKPNENSLKWITTTNGKDNSIFYIYPNTFDFEILDSNVRRNDIEYYKGKRIIPLKSNRPYNLEDWKKFIKFKEIFKNRPSKLQKLVNIIYKCLEDWDDGYKESIKQFLATNFINTLELNKKSNETVIKDLCEIFGIDTNLENKNLEKFRDELIDKIDKDKMQMFIDMFEFWHKGLKAV